MSANPAFSTAANRIDPQTTPLERLDVSRSELALDESFKPCFERLRREAPVHYLADSAFGPFWSVTRYDDVVAVEADPETYSSSWELGGITIADMQNLGVQLRMFIAMDDPEHARQRKTVTPALLPGEVKKMADPMRERTASLLDELPVGETFDWVERVSVELTTRMLAILFDFPWEERHKIPYWSDWTGNIDIAIDPVKNVERERVILEMAAYFKRLFDERKALPPSGDLLSMMAHSEFMSDLDEQSFIGNISLLVVGGNDTTRHSMSGLIHQINRYPEQWAKLKARPDLAANAAIEVIRLQTPIAHMRRTVTRDTELGGQRLRRGDKVVIWYCSANRDESVFPDGDRFDVERENARRHLSFGYGIHRCLGSRLAELQLSTLIECMLERDMQVKLEAPPERLASCFLYGFRHMPVSITRA
ncbi:MAG: cytochrome P450 [Gammaproteobacteria bacterium]